MKNKENLKKHILVIIIVFAIFAIILITINAVQFKKINQNYNVVINQIINNIRQNYPEADINEIIRILNNNNIDETDILKEYGINISKDIAIMQNQNLYGNFIILSVVVFSLFLATIIVLLVQNNKKQERQIAKITQYIEEINNGNYTLDIQENNEDELSILKNELYKITVMLKEQSENSTKDKLQLKKSLEDISHQLKTPLTSITIMLDNLLDNQNMDIVTRNDFLKSIYREITNINFFIQALLKLSKFDANTIKFNSNKTKIQDIVKEAKRNVETLCDLKNIEIEIEQEKEINNDNEKANWLSVTEYNIICDFKWQVEAVTNILKNCVEHSNSNSKIYIKINNNNVFSEITIKDNGSGIDAKDLKHIFERFYKGKNSSKESVGIGLSLAKTIIEKDNGYITVESEIGKGTTFRIRYLK